MVNMKAETMFKELGYQKIYDEDDGILYSNRDILNKQEYTHYTDIYFYIYEKSFKVVTRDYQLNTSIPATIYFNLLTAINKQVEELKEKGKCQ